MFGGEANAGVSFQIGQLRYVLFHDEYIPVRTEYIQGTYCTENVSHAAGLETEQFP
jgi:hypothetical protein